MHFTSRLTLFTLLAFVLVSKIPKFSYLVRSFSSSFGFSCRAVSYGGTLPVCQVLSVRTQCILHRVASQLHIHDGFVILVNRGSPEAMSR